MGRTYSLVIMAAGLGSRFSGGIKQLERLGPDGEIIMDYSIHDALEAGFNQVVFIIRKDLEKVFREVIGNRVEAVCRARGVEVLYAYQDLKNLPGIFICPQERTKPWGTGHAVLACAELLKNPFVVLNADDYYGKEAFRLLYQYLSSLPEGSKGKYCMAGFRLGNTLSEYGGVTRGLCQVNENGGLIRIKETRHLIKTVDGAAVETASGLIPVDLETRVSMNIWGFTPDVLELLDGEFRAFLAERLTFPDSEFLIPIVMDGLLAEGRAAIQVLPTQDHWFGMTYRGDVPHVKESFQALHESGVYHTPLYD